ncbi:MAG: PadR family transcriptional regulator [Rhizobiales bacterium]|nr:PadR family transcriptional regulator [Hyphomicrobiales bacterium]
MNVRTLCLGILSMGEASGYEIKKEIEEGLFSHFIEASFGSIYPALTQLASDGLLTVRAEEQTGKPDKKVYAITENGRQHLIRSLQVTPARDKYKSEFLFEMLFAEHLPHNHIVARSRSRSGNCKRTCSVLKSAVPRATEMPALNSWPATVKRC